MSTQTYLFRDHPVHCQMDADCAAWLQSIPVGEAVILCDYHIYQTYHRWFQPHPVIKIPAGEAHKIQSTADTIIAELMKYEAGRKTRLIAVGGGVLTDLGGYVASIYKRGMPLVLVPTSLLGMIDAGIGGKNGVNVGAAKNQVGTTWQPQEILFDYRFLDSLPAAEWVNGMAEMIKHACIQDALLFQELERYDLHTLSTDRLLMAELIERNVAIKMKIVQQDEFEQKERKWLNFGHTIGHAIEHGHQLSHGHAVSVGMVAAANLSVMRGSLAADQAARLIRLLHRYHLPVDVETDYGQIWDYLLQDKKRQGGSIDFILLKQLGEAYTTTIPLPELQALLPQIV